MNTKISWASLKESVKFDLDQTEASEMPTPATKDEVSVTAETVTVDDKLEPEEMQDIKVR